jgi:hypothetical protein
MWEPQTGKGRFFALSAARILTVLLIAGGMVFAFGEREFLDPAIGFPLGLIMIAVGFIGLFLIIPKLTRRWRTPL